MATTNRNLGFTILELIESSQRTLKAAPLNLGGLPGTGGGKGSPPGGYIGWLPQTRVAYDYDEFATLDNPASGISLLDNLNHIRYRLNMLESGGSITVVDDNTPVTYYDVTELHFSGAVVDINQLGSGIIQVVIDAVGSGGTALTVEEYDGSPSITNVDKIIFSGATITDMGSGDVLVVFSGGTEQVLHKYNEDLTPNSTTSVFSTSLVYASGTLRVYYQGARQRKGIHYLDDVDFITFSTYFPVYSGEEVIVDYNYYESGQTVGGSLIDSGGDLLSDSEGIIITESL